MEAAQGEALRARLLVSDLASDGGMLALRWQRADPDPCSVFCPSQGLSAEQRVAAPLALQYVCTLLTTCLRARNPLGAVRPDGRSRQRGAATARRSSRQEADIVPHLGIPEQTSGSQAGIQCCLLKVAVHACNPQVAARG